MLRSLLLVVAVAAAGCANPRERAFTRAVDQYAVESKLLDEYDAYVDGDASLARPNSKKIRKQSSAKLRNLIELQKKALEE